MSVQPVDRLKAESQRVFRPRSIEYQYSPGQKRTESEALLSKLHYCRSLALIEDLSNQFEDREANRREKPASKSGQVEVSLPSSCSTASSELATFFFLVWWRLWHPNFFQRRLSTTIAQRAFQHGLLATRISKRRDFLTCRSSSTGPSNFRATPSLPRYANPDKNC